MTTWFSLRGFGASELRSFFTNDSLLSHVYRQSEVCAFAHFVEPLLLRIA